MATEINNPRASKWVKINVSDGSLHRCNSAKNNNTSNDQPIPSANDIQIAKLSQVVSDLEARVDKLTETVDLLLSEVRARRMNGSK